jgi:hypothetical protein
MPPRHPHSRNARTSAADRRPAPTGPGGDDGLERLAALLDSAASLDLRDRVGWTRLRDAARWTIGGLVAGSRLPHYLAIAPDDPPVLVTRTIAAAWRHASASPRHREATRVAS